MQDLYSFLSCGLGSGFILKLRAMHQAGYIQFLCSGLGLEMIFKLRPKHRAGFLCCAQSTLLDF